MLPTKDRVATVTHHILADITQKQGRDDTHSSKCDTHEVHILVARSVRQLAGVYDSLPRAGNTFDAGKLGDLVDQGGAGERDGLADDGLVGDVVLEGHGAPDVLDGVGDEFAGSWLVKAGVRMG